MFADKYERQKYHAEKNQRTEIWNCLKTDDEVALKRALKVFGYKQSEDLKKLELILWKNSAGKGGKRVGLASTCAFNKTGVPSELGAIKCLRMLFKEYGVSSLGEREEVYKNMEKFKRLAERDPSMPDRSQTIQEILSWLEKEE